MQNGVISAGGQGRYSKKPHGLQILLAFILIVILLVLVRYVPLIGYSSAPASFSGGFAYRYNQAIQQGYDSNVNVPVFSSFDSGVNPVRGEILFVKLQVMMSEVVGYNRYAGDLFSSSFAESLALTVGFLAMGWMWSRKLYNETTSGPREWRRVLIALTFVAGSPAMVLFLLGWNAAFGWYFILSVVYLWQKRVSITKNRALAIAFSFVLFGLYTTAAIALLTLTVFMTLFMRRSFLGIALALVVYATAFFSYLSQLMFGTLLQLPAAALAVLQFESKSSGFEYLAASTPATRLLNGAAAAAIAIPLILTLRPRNVGSRLTIERQLPRASVATVLVYALGAAATIGILSGLLRATEYLAIFSFMAIPLCLKWNRTSLRRMTVIALVVAVALSLTIHVTSPTTPAQYLTPQENSAANWITSNRNEAVVVFTDFRLAGALVGSGYLKVIGISDIDLSASQVNRLLYDVYYSGDPCAAAAGLAGTTTYTGQSYDLLLVSQRMTDDFPAIKGYNYNFAPAPTGFTGTYDMILSLAKVYDDGQAQVFARTTPPGGTC